MLEKQRTIAKEVTCTGIGLHTGNETSVTFKPAQINTGVRFIRTDLPGRPEIPADIDHVVDISRGTTIAIGEAKVHTVEHLLAALAGLSIDNLYVEVSTNEPPVGDGSALIFVEALNSAGYVEQDSPKDFIVVEDTIVYDDVKNEGIELMVLPSDDDFRITFMVDYQNPVVGTQYTSTQSSVEEVFVKEYAPARTFCFLSEVEVLKEQGLIKGGTLDNAMVVVDKEVDEQEMAYLTQLFEVEGGVFAGENGVLNGTPLRFPNEFCRHKALDLMGDLFLLGGPLRGHVLAARSGHKANIELVKKIRKVYEKKQIAAKYQDTKRAGLFFDTSAILKIMPHRYPFLLVDRIIDLIPRERVVGLKNVTVNEPFFQGHFPGQPVMPGVLEIEAMAQVGGVLLLNTADRPEEKLVLLTGIDNAKFRKPVVPGDQIRFELDMVKSRRNVCRMQGKAFVGGDLVAEAELTAMVVDRQDAGK